MYDELSTDELSTAKTIVVSVLKSILSNGSRLLFYFFWFKAGLRSIHGLGPKIRSAMTGKIEEEDENGEGTIEQQEVMEQKVRGMLRLK